ncbi:MAG TPA: glycosyltransferase family 39 protein [Pyrinomonadaceae bacterium]|nr:glycosyltransferase family 39 protein [Pyrinomonadaceae bacterium]
MTVSQTTEPTTTEGKKSLSGLLTAGVVVLFVAVRLWRLSASCLWFDEIFSVHAAHHGWGELLRFAAADLIHPPLFYLLLKIWISLGGESLLWLRLLPALISIAAIVPFWLLCRELKLSQNERNLALLLLAGNGYLIKYAQELRMYSLLMLLSVCSLWLFVKWFRSERGARKQLGWLLLTNLFLVYSHYAGWIVVGVECLALLVWQRKKTKATFVGLGVLLLAYAPWLFLISANRDAGKGLAQNIGWVTRPTWRDIAQLFALLNKPFWSIQSTAARPFDLLTAFFALLIVGAPLIFLTMRVWRGTVLANDSNPQTFRAVSLFTLAPVIIVFGLSWLLPQSVWGTRHLIVVAAPYAILVSVAIVRVPLPWLRIAAVLVLGSWLLLAGIAWALTPPPVLIWCAWEPLAHKLEESAPQAQEVRVYAFEDLVAYHLWFAFDSSHRKQFKVMVVKGLEGIPEDPAYFLPRRFNEIAVVNTKQITGDDIWVAFRAPRWDETLPPLSTLESMGYISRAVQSVQAQGQQAYVVRMTR